LAPTDAEGRLDSFAHTIDQLEPLDLPNGIVNPRAQADHNDGVNDLDLGDCKLTCRPNEIRLRYRSTQASRLYKGEEIRCENITEVQIEVLVQKCNEIAIGQKSRRVPKFHCLSIESGPQTILRRPILEHHHDWRILIAC
jgi:hypothetical protein